MSLVLKVIRMLAGVAGVLFEIFTLSILFNDSKDPLSSRLMFAGVTFVVGVLLLSFAARMKVRWTPAWAVGWILALGGAAQEFYSFYGYTHAANAAQKVASVFWALVAPLQLYWGARLVNFAKRATAPRLRELDCDDPRAPILLLRPFEVDTRTGKLRPGKDSSAFALFAFNTRTEEELIAEVMNDIGPCVAIGRPQEKLPQLGFKRIYLGDQQQWQDKVLEYMGQARLVVLLLGKTPNFLWELGKALEMVRPERLLFLIPSGTEFMQMVQPLLPHAPPEMPENAIFPAATFAAVLYFDPDWTPRYAIPEAPSRFRQTRAQKVTPALKMALRPVYARLGQQWTKPPLLWSRIIFEGTVAVSVLFVLRVIFFHLFGK